MNSVAKRVLVVFGTRPEAIKMAPIVHALAAIAPGISTRICVTGQHREMLDQVLALFKIVPDWDLDVMRLNQDLTDVTANVLVGMRRVLKEWPPTLVLVQGDTTSALAAAIAAFYEKIPVGHVEAGLRTGEMYLPWPEEMNRKLITALATYHFAPTQAARSNLLREGVAPSKIWVTGNTVIDALLKVVAMTRDDPSFRVALEQRYKFLNGTRRVLIVTMHRRENFGAGLEQVCLALRRLAERNEVEIVFPVHLNPNVQEPTHRILGGLANVHLIEPLDYLPFVVLLDRAYLILTDSGGIQEEAPSLGKPVLVVRASTERPEAVEAGTVRLVGTDAETIVAETERLLNISEQYAEMAQAHNPYGDGKAALRIAEAISLN